MITLTPDECRVLGVLVEKAQTTPAQYPLTLNSLTLGCNQKSNRDPMTNFSDDRAQDALDSLRAKGLVREAMLSGSRVHKYRHIAREAMQVTTAELAVLTELLLRGPQSAGELKTRATRMHPFESVEAVQAALVSLASRAEPLVRELPRRSGERLSRHVQLLCEGLHPIDTPMSVSSRDTDPGDAPDRAAGAGNAGDLGSRVRTLEAQVVELRSALSALASSLGSEDPFGRDS